MVKLMFNETADYFEFIEYLQNKVREEANLREKNDQVHGSGGALLREKLDIYMNALNKEIPVEWVGYYENFSEIKKRERDPEYAEFVRLKEKFEGEKNGI